MADSDWHVSGFVPDSDAEDEVSDLLGTPTQNELPSKSSRSPESFSAPGENARKFVSVLVPERQDEISEDELAMPYPASMRKQKSVPDESTQPDVVEKGIFDVPSSNPTIHLASERAISPAAQDEVRPEITIVEGDSDSDDSPLSSVSSSRSSSPLLPYIPFRSSQHIPIESPTLTQLPVSIDLDNDFTAVQPQIRSLRERKAIQLHPYAVEGMLYRQTMHSRGIQAVRLANGESQVDAQNVQDPGSSSQVDGDFVMTQESQPQDTQYIETLDLRDIGRELDGQVVNGGKRRRLSNWRERRPSIDLHEFLPGMDEFEMPDDEGQDVENENEHDLPRRVVFKRPPLFPNVTTEMDDQDMPQTVLPTPISLDSGDAEGHNIGDSDVQSNSDQQTDSSTDSQSDDSEASTAESAVQENLKHHAKRLRGFLPASYVRLDQAEQTRSSKTTNEQRRIRDREKQERLRRLREERAQANQEPIREIAPIFDSDESDTEPKRSRIDHFLRRPVPDIAISRSPTRSPPDDERRHSEPILLSESDPDTDDMEDNQIDRMLGPGRQRPTAYQTFLDNDLKVARKRKWRERRESGKKRARISVDHLHQLKYHDLAESSHQDIASRLEHTARLPLHPISRNLKQPLSRHDQPKTPRSGQIPESRSHGSARHRVSERHARDFPHYAGPSINHVRSSTSSATPIRKPNLKLQVTRRPAEGSKLTSFVNNFTPTHVAQLEVPRQRHGGVNIPDLDQNAPLHVRAFRHDRLGSRDAHFLDDVRHVGEQSRLMVGNTAQSNTAVEQTVKPRRRSQTKKGKASSRTSLHQQRPLLGPFLDNLSPPPAAYLVDEAQIAGDSERQWQETRSVNLSFRATSTFDVEPLSTAKITLRGSVLNGDLLARVLQPQRNEDIDSCFQEPWIPADTQRLREQVTEVTVNVLNGATNVEDISGKVKDLVDLLCMSTKDFAHQDSPVQLEIWRALTPLFESYSITPDLTLLADSEDGTVAEIAYIYIRVILLLLHVRKNISARPLVPEVDRLLLLNMKVLMRILAKFTQSIKQVLRQCLHPDPSSLSPRPSQEKLLEAAVVLNHVAEQKESPSQSIWSLMDITPDSFAAELSEKVEQHEQLWGFSFLLLPILTVDPHGHVMETNKRYPGQQGWKALRPLVVDVLNNYESAAPPMRKQLLVYIRFLLLRSLHLITTWHWDQCEAIIGTFFDFFARNQLRHLEGPIYPALANRHVSSVIETPASVTDHAFLLLLKLIVAALKEKRGTNEKQLGNLVFRLIPNHGRSYPRDQDIAAQDLDSLQNNHDLLWVLLAFTPKQYRPRLSHFENLVSFQSSHLEACRINVKTWYHCARSMLEQDPTIDELEPLWTWFRTALKCAVEQHRRTRSDVQAEQAELAKAGRPMQQKNVEAQIRRNESSIELILVDMAHAMSETLKTVTNPVFACRFLDCGIVDLLSVGNIQKRDVDTILRVSFDSVRTVLSTIDANKDNEASDDSQGFGDWSGFEELEGEPASEQEKAQIPTNLERELYALLGKACGPEKCSRSFLEELVITWACLCSHNVRKRTASWDDYTGEYGSYSWLKLRDTLRARELGLLFYSEVLQAPSTNVPELVVAAVQTLLVRLTDPEPLFSYQHVLLNVVLNKGLDALFDDFPFSRSPADGTYHVGVSDLLQCRVAVFASIFSTMHRHLADDVSTSTEKRHLYKKYIASMQASMKARILERTTSISDAEFKTYTAFVYRVIELIQEHIPEVAHIDPIFMDSSKFPQLHQDPMFVVSKLKNLARHLLENRSPKQLVSFVFHVLEQALQDGTQSRTEKYFIDAAETRALNEKSLQSFLLMEFIAQCIVAVRGDACGYILIAPLVNAITTLFSRVLTVVNTKDVHHTETAYEFILKHCDVLFTAWISTYQDVKASRNANLRSYARPILTAFEHAIHHCINVLVFVSKTTKLDLSDDRRVTNWRTALADLDKQARISGSEETSNLATFTRSEARTILDRWTLENGELSIRKGNQKEKIALPAIQVFDESVERERESLLGALTNATRGSSEQMGWSERQESSWAVAAFLRWED